jgi:hypothetical protein
VADEPDNRVLEAAVEAGVDAVVTGDAQTGLHAAGHEPRLDDHRENTGPSPNIAAGLRKSR